MIASMLEEQRDLMDFSKTDQLKYIIKYYHIYRMLIYQEMSEIFVSLIGKFWMYCCAVRREIDISDDCLLDLVFVQVL